MVSTESSKTITVSTMVSTESSKTITAISVSWGSGVGGNCSWGSNSGNWSWGSGKGNWGSYLVYVWYSCWFKVYVWFSCDFGMNIGFSSDFGVDVGFGSWVYLSGIIVWVDVCSWVSGISYWGSSGCWGSKSVSVSSITSTITSIWVAISSTICS